MNEKLSLENLTKFNLKMGIVHFVQAVIMLVLAFTVIQATSDFDFTPTITQHYLSFNTDTQSLEFASRDLFNLPFGVLVSMFLFISAFAHFIIAVPKRTNSRYKKDLEIGINQFRWFEYALSSSIMIVLIAVLFGIYDIGSLVLIFIVNATMNLFGLVMEQLNVGKQGSDVRWGPFIWGSIAGIAPWIVILIYMFGTGNFDMVPWFVWAIVGTYFVAFNSFPVNMVLQYKGIGKWQNYLYGERVYIILSLVAKSVLAWLVFFGALQP